jgi:signal transduction histidine kinase
MLVDDLRSLSLFDGLADHHLAELVEAGTEVRVEPGTELFHEGMHADYWWVLLDGTIDLVRRVGGEDVVVGRMDAPGRWAGGFRAWDEHGVYLATGRAVAHGRLLRLPAEVLRERSSAWFSFGAHLIEGLYRTARTIESTARQRESLVSLGTLAAGLAHEINNPAAAAARAAEHLQRECDTLLSSLGRLAANGISAAQFTVLDELRRELGQRVATPDPLAAADLESAVSSWLSSRGVDKDWMIAPPLAAAGADLAWCERAATNLPGAALEPGLEWVASTVSVVTLLAEVRESTRRIADLVAAVKSYSQLDRASIQSIDVRDGIESTLAILGYKLGDGIEVIRDYGAEVPRIEAYASELNQVWTNLIDNAVDAMGGAGALRITTRAGGDHVVVEIGDTGPGMPPAVAARAFEAFYTTKDVGQGTGLGLDIARRIVEERHSGKISIHSRPGRTLLRVRLPVRPPANRRG